MVALRFFVPRRDGRRFPRLPLRAVLALLLVGVASCAGDREVEDRRAALEQERKQLLDQFAAAQNRVRRTQARALGDPSIAPLQERFYERLRETMVEIEPRAEAWLTRARELGPEIDVLSQPQILEPGEEPVSRDVQRALVDEFAALEDSLRPVQNRALADSGVAAVFDSLQDSVHAKMVEINPAAASALDQMRRTSAAVDSIDAELRRLPAP